MPDRLNIDALNAADNALLNAFVEVADINKRVQAKLKNAPADVLNDDVKCAKLVNKLWAEETDVESDDDADVKFAAMERDGIVNTSDEKKSLAKVDDGDSADRLDKLNSDSGVKFSKAKVDNGGGLGYNNLALSNKEWKEFYNSLGALNQGRWFPQTSDGFFVFETANKLIFTDGDYSSPKIEMVVAIDENLDADTIEYGKEIVYHATQGNQTCEE